MLLLLTLMVMVVVVVVVGTTRTMRRRMRMMMVMMMITTSLQRTYCVTSSGNDEINYSPCLRDPCSGYLDAPLKRVVVA